MAGIICDHNAKKPQNANLNAVIIAAQNVPFWKRQVKRFRKLPHKKHKINIDFQMKYPSFSEARKYFFVLDDFKVVD